MAFRIVNVFICKMCGELPKLIYHIHDEIVLAKECECEKEEGFKGGVKWEAIPMGYCGRAGVPLELTLEGQS